MRTLAFLAVLILMSGLAANAETAPEGVYNPSFEEREAGWRWMTMGVYPMWYRSETENPHTGSRCMVFVNKSGFGPNVYGQFSQGVDVLPETEYELSVWVRGEDVKGEPGPSHFTDWSTYTLNLPAGSFGWTKVSTRFRTNTGQSTLTLGLNVANSCKVLAIDDVSLTPIGSPIKGDGIEGSFLTPARLFGHDSVASLQVMVRSSLHRSAKLELSVDSGGRKVFSKQGAVKPGENKLELPWDSGKAPFGEFEAAVRIMDANGKLVAEASRKIEKIDSPMTTELTKIQSRFKGEFSDLYKQCADRGITLDYPQVTKTLIEQYVPLTTIDIRKAKNWRAEFAIKDMNRVLDESIAQMRSYLSDPRTIPNARRYQTSKSDIRGLQFVADRKDSQGKKDRGPVFFAGYGHFGQLRKDMPRWPGYGINIIQFSEFGPSAVFPEEGKVSLDMPKLLVNTLDNAAKHNVKVDFLISPHYFPNWAIQKWPHLAKGGGGFLGFVPDEKEAKQIMEDFLKIVIPMVKDKPALHSICLSNEPVLTDTTRADNTRPMWAAYLAKVHGDLKTMNERYGTGYKSFEEVHVPENASFKDPQFYDWCVFNNERFAGWHKWMADVIHEMAPNLPVHAKVMSNWLNRDTVAWGCDAECFGAMGQIAGNDCCFMGDGGPGWAVPWFAQNISYDLQRSSTGQPIFNSENHISPDRATHYIAPEHFRTALWQGMMHGQSATTIWAWETAFILGYDLYGLVMDRPGCAHAVGTTSLDLNRFADDIAAIQSEKSPAAILFSTASLALDPGYVNAVGQIYTALCFHGFRVDFITEKQLQSGKGSEYRMIIFPNSTHVLPATLNAVKALPESVRIVFHGECLTKDPYNHDLPGDDVKAVSQRALVLEGNPDAGKLWPKMQEELGRAGVLPEVSVVDAYTDEPIWGLEWLPTKREGRTVISLVNLRDKPAYVKFLLRGRRVQAWDLLSLGGRDSVRIIKPITPVLAEVRD